MKTRDLLDHPDSFEHRLSVGLEHIAEAGSVSSPSRFDPDAMPVDRPSDPRSSRWLVGAAAAAVVVLGVGGLVVANRPVPDPAPAQQPSSTESASPAPTLHTPVWYDTIRPLLPDGFDQIVLTDAAPEVVGFKAFRTGTRQLLDVTITLQSGYGMKDTGEAVTFSDDYGDYIESAGSVALTTPDQRQVIIRCGVRPIGGGSYETGGLLEADLDTCDENVDNLDIDAMSRRSLAAKLAGEFPTDIVTPAFGQPNTSPVPTAVSSIVDSFAGDARPFGTMQADGVLRVANLSPAIGEPSTTELTVVQGLWPPNGDGSALDGTYASSPQARFHLYGDIAVALVVVDTTGYHIATTDLSDTHLSALGELLQQLIAASPGTGSPATTPLPLNTAPATTDLATVDQRWYLFPDAESTMRYLDPADVLDAYLADRITTAPGGQTVTYMVSSEGPSFDGTPDRVLIGFSLTVTPDDPALCCDSGDGVAYIERVDGAWFVASAEIPAMQVATLRYSDDGVVSGAFSPTIGGTYNVTVAGFGSPAPDADSIVVEYEPDPADPTNGPTLELRGFTAPAVAVRFWQSPSSGTPYPAAMYAEFIITKGTENASNISIDPSAPMTAEP